MPKLLLVFSELKKKDRKAQTSLQNVKKLIEERITKEAEDKVYNIVTINTKMKLANVVSIINSSQKALTKHEGIVSVEKLTIHPDKTRGKWEIETLSGGDKPKKAKKPTEEATESNTPKKKKKKKGKKA